MQQTNAVKSGGIWTKTFEPSSKGERFVGISEKWVSAKINRTASEEVRPSLAWISSKSEKSWSGAQIGAVLS